MRSTLVLALLLLALAPLTAAATTVLELSFDELTKESDAIVVGHVESVTAEVREGRVYSTIVVSVDESLKGTPGESVKIVQLGGKTKDLVTRAFGMPNFEAGEHVLLFLEKPNRVNYFVVTGLTQGKKSLSTSEDGTLQLRDDPTPVHTVRPKLTAVPKIATPRLATTPATLEAAKTRIAELSAR